MRCINSAIRHIWYPLRGYYPSKERSVYICPALEQLIRIIEDDYTLLLVCTNYQLSLFTKLFM